MKNKIASGVIGIVAISGGVDASILNEKPIPLTEVALKEEVVTLEQKGNVIEAGMPWKDQLGIKVKYDLGEPTVAERFADKRKKGIITETVDIGDGGFKIDVLLNEKPDTNTFCYTIEGAENYDFFLQPALTPEEIAEGVARPEEIVGSYAVYHKTLKNHQVGRENYATGKVMHIPFPYVWEVNASSTTRQRAENMTYENGQLCVTVQQDFLDNATYPVRVDPTFGYTTIGGTETGFSANLWKGSRETSASDATSFDKITAYVRSAASDQNHKSVVTDSSLVIISGGISNATTIVTGTGLQWKDFTYSSSPTILSSTDYYLGIISESTGVTVFHDTVAGLGRTDTTNSYSSPTNPTDATSADRRYSIYATYTASSGSTPQGEEVIFFE